MSRTINRPGGGNNKDIDEGLKLIVRQIENIANRTKANKENIDEKILEQYRENVVNLSKNIAGVVYEYNETTDSINVVLSNYKADDTTTREAVKDIIKKRIRERTSHYDVTKDTQVLKIRKLLKILDENDIEGEFEVVDQVGLQEASLICPYTQSRYVDPMMNPGICIHRISRAALQALCRINGSGRCPVPGCVKSWTLKNARLDTEFLKQMEQFDNAKNNNTTSTQVIDHDYTQV